MPMPTDLPNYLKEIQEYLESQQKELQKKYKKQKEDLLQQDPLKDLPQEDPFLELAKAINCVKSLGAIHAKILEYWEDLEK